MRSPLRPRPRSVDQAARTHGAPAGHPLRGRARPRRGSHRVHARRPGDRRLPAARRRHVGGRRTGAARPAGRLRVRPRHAAVPGSRPFGRAGGTSRPRRRTKCDPGPHRRTEPCRDRPHRRTRRRPVRGPGRRWGVRGHAGRRWSARARRNASPPPGDGLPPVLGGQRRRPRLRGSVDDRLLQRRFRQVRQPPQDRSRWHADDRLGWLDELADDIDHQRCPHEGHTRRPDDLGVRLDERPGRAPGSAPRQSGGPPEPRRPGGRRRPREGRRRDQPRLRADRFRLRRRVHALRPGRPRRAQQASRRLPAHVRHDRLHRQLPDRGRHRTRRRRRDLHHGLRLPDGRLGLRRFDRPAVGARVRPPGHRQCLRRQGGAVEAHPRRAVVRPGLVDRFGLGQRQDPDRLEVRGIEQRPLRHRGRLRGAVRQALGQPRAEPVDRLSAPELLHDVRLRHDLAPGLLRRRRLAEAALRHDQSDGPPGDGDLGPRV